MSWIQENKLISGLVGVTVLIGGGIVYFGATEGGAFNEQMLAYQDLKSKHTKLVGAKPYPDTQNLQIRKDNIKQYEDMIADVRKVLDVYRPGKLTKLSPGEFSDAQVKMQGELRKAFVKAGTTLPDKCRFGFEKYADIQAKAIATARLNYQLGAMQWLLEKLAEAKPEALINIHRKELDVERGIVATPPPEPKSRGKRAGRANQAKAPVDQKLFAMMPVELSFTATEASIRDFLKEMVNSNEYFYAIRTIRIRNEKQNAPTTKDANFPEAARVRNEGVVPAPDDIFRGFVLPGDDLENDEGDGGVSLPAPAIEKADSQHILKQVLGSEKLHIHISFDILLIKGDAAPKAVAAPPSPGGA